MTGLAGLSRHCWHLKNHQDHDMNKFQFDKSDIIESASGESDELSAESQGRIGVGIPSNKTKIILTVHVPLIAQNIRIKGYLRNSAWPDGCGMSSSDWKEVDLFKHHEPIGWASAGHVARGTTPTSQWVSATFVNWSHCNPRHGRLQVFYKLPCCSKSEIKLLEVDASIQEPFFVP